MGTHDAKQTARTEDAPLPDGLFYTVALGTDLNFSLLYERESDAEKFVTSWNANKKIAAQYPPVRVVLVRVTECADDYNNSDPLI